LLLLLSIRRHCCVILIVLLHLSRLLLRCRRLRPSKHIKRCRRWLLHLLLLLKVALIHHVHLLRHAIPSHVLVWVISTHLTTVSSHHAALCCRLVLIHHHLLLRIHHEVIASITTHHVILGWLLLCCHKAREIRLEFWFIFSTFDLLPR
jgi:hypothetical protein